MKLSIKTLCCGLLLAFPGAVHAQLGDFFDAVRETARQSLNSSHLGTKPITEAQIIGTWSYSNPLLVFENRNIACKLGAAMASGDLEDRMSSALGRVGINPAKTTLTFKSDGTFTASSNGNTVSGSYKLKGANIYLTLPGHGAVAVNALRDGHELQLAVKPNHFPELVRSLTHLSASSATTVQMFLSSLSSSEGYYLALVLRKQ